MPYKPSTELCGFKITIFLLHFGIYLFYLFMYRSLLYCDAMWYVLYIGINNSEKLTVH
jgi:hypothetical protein